MQEQKTHTLKHTHTLTHTIVFVFFKGRVSISMWFCVCFDVLFNVCVFFPMCFCWWVLCVLLRLLFYGVFCFAIVFPKIFIVPYKKSRGGYLFYCAKNPFKHSHTNTHNCVCVFLRVCVYLNVFLCVLRCCLVCVLLFVYCLFMSFLLCVF